MLSLILSILVISLVFIYCNNFLEILVSFFFIILFICLVRDWSLLDFWNNFTEMFEPISSWIKSQEKNIENIK